jgi:hypothetical protein
MKFITPLETASSPTDGSIRISAMLPHHQGSAINKGQGRDRFILGQSRMHELKDLLATQTLNATAKL